MENQLWPGAIVSTIEVPGGCTKQVSFVRLSRHEHSSNLAVPRHGHDMFR